MKNDVTKKCLDKMVYRLNPEIDIHLFGSESVVYTDNSGNFYLNRIHTTILLLCNERTIEEIIDAFYVMHYNILNNNIDISQLIKRSVEMLKSNHIIIETTICKEYSSFKFTGEKDKFFPYKISIELTNQCNYMCKYCYNESSSKCKDFFPKDTIYDIIEKFKGKTKIIQLIGGEPLLYPNIEDIIDEFSKEFETTITTNGYFVNRIREETLKKLSYITISMYGYDEPSYNDFTGAKNAFYMFEKSLLYLNHNSIKYSVAITITKYNIFHIEEYILTLIRLKAQKVFFGLPVIIGRALDNREKYTISSDEIRYITHLLKVLTVKYGRVIQINFWKSSKVLHTPLLPEKIYSKYCYLCGGGILDYTITPNLFIKPCGYLPEESCNIKYDDIDNLIHGRNFDLLSSAKHNISQYIYDKGISLSNICDLLS